MLGSIGDQITKESFIFNVPRTKATKTGYRKVEVAIDTKRIEELLLLTKQTDSRVHALFSKVHNIQVDQEKLTAQIAKLILTFRELLDNPENVRDSENIVKSFVMEILKKQR